MIRQALVTPLCVIAVVALVPLATAGQNSSRTPWGDPDLQGTYTNKTITPLERPNDVGDKKFENGGAKIDHSAAV